MGGPLDLDVLRESVREIDDRSDIGLGQTVTPKTFDPDVLREAATEVGNSDKDVVLENALKTNPDKRATDIKTGQKLGIPANIVEQESEAFANKAKARDIKQKALDLPMLREAVSNIDTSQVIHDDVDALGTFEKILSSLSRRWATGERNVEMSDIGNRLIWGTARHGDEERLEQLQREAAASAGVDQEHDLGFFGSWPGDISEQLPLMMTIMGRTWDEVATGTAMGAAAGLAGGPLAPITVTAGAIGGFGAGMLTGAALETGKLEAGLAFAEYRNLTDENGKKVDVDTARGIALMVGTFNGAVEVATLKVMGRMIPGFHQLKSMMTRKGIKEMLKVPTVRAALTRLGRNMIRTGTTEGFVEAVQEIALITGSVALGKDTNWWENTKQVGHSFVMGAKVGTSFAATGGSIQTYQRIQAAKRAVQRQEAMMALSETAVNSKTMERLPDQMKKFVTSIKEHYGTIEEVYIDKDVLITYYQTAGAAPSETILQAIEEAQDGADVEISIEDLATELAPSEGFAELSQDIRFHPDEMTARQAQVAMEEARALVEDAAAEGIDLTEDQVYVDISTAAMEAGETAEVADQQGRVHAAFFRKIAGELGTTPEELYARQTLDVQREGEQLATPLSRPGDSPEQTEVYKAKIAHNEAKARQAEAKEAWDAFNEPLSAEELRPITAEESKRRDELGAALVAAKEATKAAEKVWHDSIATELDVRNAAKTREKEWPLTLRVLQQGGDNIIQFAGERTPSENEAALAGLIEEVGAILKTGRPGDPFFDRATEELQKLNAEITKRGEAAKEAGARLEAIKEQLLAGEISARDVEALRAEMKAKFLSEQITPEETVEYTQRVLDVLRSGQPFPANDLFQRNARVVEADFIPALRDRETGATVDGANHGEAYLNIADEEGFLDEDPEEGFIDGEGRFWTKDEVLKEYGFYTSEELQHIESEHYFQQRILFQSEVPGVSIEDAKPVPAHKYKLTKKDKARVKKLKARVPGLSKVLPYLQDDEVAQLNLARAKKIVELYDKMPSVQEMAAVAIAGRAKRGWYLRSVAALRRIYGEDAPRFAALLAALSPQQSVESNIENAVNVWNGWVAAGRPTDTAMISRIIGENVQGDKGEASVMEAWLGNSLRALQAEDQTAIDLDVSISGPKVNSFMLNLLGFFNEVTNDAWMANYSGVDQEVFASNYSAPMPHKSSGYLAMSARARAAAKSLTKSTGENWTPAEVQETIWSWTKALYEKADEAGETRGALKILQDGDLSHEEIDSVPDFNTLLGGAPIDAGAERLTGSSYDPDSKQAPHLNRAARRLEKLRTERAAAAVRSEVMLNLSAATDNALALPGVAELTARARGGDQAAALLLQEIAADTLRVLTERIKSAKVEVTPATGLYGGEIEPSLGVTLSFTERDREAALAAIARFADNYTQEQMHVRTGKANRTKVGHQYKDGSYNTSVVRFHLTKPMSRGEVQKVIDDSGLFGLTITDGYLETYYLGDPNDLESIADFIEASRRARKSLGNRSTNHTPGVDRIWAYGSGDGATHSYGDIRRDIRPAAKDQASASSQRVASSLAGRAVKGAKPATTTTKDQKEIQTRIADAFEGLRLNAMDDPVVLRAYEAAAAELLRQYEALPIKVEVWKGKGQPYQDSKGKVSSKKMRQDVILNNHLYIYGTEAETFGPPGETFEGHPFLEPSGRVDMNGAPLLINDLLRAVHDYYAHTMTTATFGPRGEEAAWRTHMEMTVDPWARWAITTETRGQNSWVNFREGAAGKTLAERGYSEQKVDLLPLEFVMTGDADIDAALGELPSSEGLALEETTAQRKERRSRESMRLQTILFENDVRSGAITRDTPGIDVDEYDAVVRKLAAETTTLKQAGGDLTAGVTPQQFMDAMVGAGIHPFNVKFRKKVSEGIRGSGSFAARKNDHQATVVAEDRKGWALTADGRIIDADGKHLTNAEVGITALAHEETRGLIQFTPDRKYFKITLTGKANRSTFMHESGHFFLEMMTKFVQDPNATERMKADYEAVRRFLGVEPGAEITTEQHEKFARAFEAYLFEGKAPSEELRGAFASFKAWLKDIYKTLTQLNVELDDEIRGVFDRMLASDEAILQAKENQEYAPVFEVMDRENFESEEAYQEYLESYKVSVQASRDDLEQKALAELKREKKKEMKEAREKIEADVKAEVEARDVYRARHFLATGEMLDGSEVPEDIRGHKMSTAGVKLLTDVPLGNLTRKDGLPPDDIAPYFGFASGQEMVEALAESKPIKTTIKEETDRRMGAIFGDMLNDGSLGPEAAKSLNSDKKAAFLLTELKVMNRRAGVKPLRTPARILKDAARERIEAIEIIKVRPEKYRQAEARAAREAAEAVANNDFAAAAQAQQRRILNHELYREAHRVREEELKIRNYLIKFGQKNKRIQLGKAGEEQYLHAIDQLLEGTSFRKRSLKSIEKMDALGAFITKQELAGEPIAIPDKLRNEAELQNYRTMTITELRELRDAVKNLDHLAMKKNKLMRAKEQRDLQKVIDQVKDTADVHLKDKTPQKMRNLEGFQKWMRKATWANSTLTKPEFLCKWLDGEVAGTLHQWLFQPFVDAQNAAYDLRKEMHEKIFKMLDELPRKQKAKWNQKVEMLGQTFRGRDIIAIALNMGNQGNIDRVVNGEAEFGWTEEKVMEFLDDWMDKADWDAVQTIWNEINVLYKPLSDVKQRLTGIRPPKVEALPFETKHGWYDGGYYPAIYDPDKSRISQEHQQNKTAIFENNYIKPEATASASEMRQGVGGRPLLFRLDGIGQHLYETIHFITHAEAVYNADKIIQHPDFERLVKEKFGNDMYNTLRPWLKTVANDAIALQEQSMIDGTMKHVRDGVSIVAMGLNLGTSMMQLFGTFTTIDAIGPKYWMIGLMKSYAPLTYNWRRVGEHWKFANEKSGEMRHLTSVFDRDIRNMENQAFGKTGLKGRLARTRQKAFLPIAYVQKIVNQSTWHGAYEQALDQGKSEEHAVNYADAIVRQAQAGGGTKDMAVVQRGGPTQQIFYMFGTFFNVLYNRLQDVVRVSGISKKSVPEVTARLSVMLVMSVMMEEWMRGGEPDDDEEWYEWAGKRVALYGVTTIPILRDIASGALGDYGYNVSPVGSAFRKMVQAAGGIEKYLEENEMTEAQWKALVTSFGVLTKLPINALWKGIKYAERAGEGDLNNPVRELIFGVDREER